jgi:excinuclease UvrABC nuclease subunit
VRDPVRVTPQELESVPDRPAVFLLRTGSGPPYLARTSLLRRRLKRLLSSGPRVSQALQLGGIVECAEYWLTGSQIESTLLFVELAQRYFPEDWRKITRLRPAHYLQLTLDNPFPRTRITTKPAKGLCFGPFLARAAAERFEQEMLDLFQLRHCEENLSPSPDHPGCIYGEMNKCLRPCQQIVGVAEYAAESARVEQFLRTSGTSLREPIESARDRASAAMQFEEAAHLHERADRIKSVQSLAGDLARVINQLFGIAVLPSSEQGCVELWFFAGGTWQEPQRIRAAQAEGAGGSLDRVFRELVAAVPRTGQSNSEHLAILARWHGSTWRDGEWIGFESWDKVPYRKLVNAVGRVLKQTP